MGLFLISVIALLLAASAEAGKVRVAPLQKHHQMSLKLSPSRWIERSNERRVKRGLKPWHGVEFAAEKKQKKSLLAEKNQPSLPTGGDLWPVAIYWSFLEVGNPGQKFPVAIDSGSFTLDIPLKGCNGCTNKTPNNFYDPSASNSSFAFKCKLFESCKVGSCDHKQDRCTFSNTYETCVPTDPTAPCTISGPFYSDVVAWGTDVSVPITFGAIDYQTSNFEQFQNIDGVCGMAGPANPQSVISQLATNNAIPAWMWSLCLQPGAVSNGTITLGGIDSRLHDGDVVYTPDVGGGQFYSMQLNGMKLGGQQVYTDEPQVIIDSGTNILLLPDETFSSMKKLFLGMCSSQNQLHGICDVGSTETLFDGKCFDFTAAQIAAFPNITISVPSIDLVMTPKNYILFEYGVNFKPGQYCLGISSTGPQGLQIVGDTLLENYLTVFDQTNQKIGWAPVSNQCGNIQA